MSEAKPFCISKWEVWEAYQTSKSRTRERQGSMTDDRGF